MNEREFTIARLGYQVVSTWHHSDNPAVIDDDGMCREAQRDLSEINGCDVLIRFADDIAAVETLDDAKKLLTAGRMVEFGYVMGLHHGWEAGGYSNLPTVIVIGKRQCVFDYLPYVRRFDSFEDFANAHQG